MSYYVLGIDTSCDETSIGIVDDKLNILANVVSSQIHLHTQYGGVVPEMAAREHLSNIQTVCIQAMKESRLNFSDIGGIAVTQGPGLSGCLAVGIAFAKGLGFSLKIPLVGVNHLEGHIWAGYLASTSLKPPFLYLVVSGGHTMLGVCNDFDSYVMLGETMDDAAGEALDKGAKLLGLPYPGGPQIDIISKKAKIRNYVNFPRPKIQKNPFSFSFSGLKTSLAFYVQKNNIKDLPQKDFCNLTASYLEAIVDSLAYRSIMAIKHTGIGTFLVVGGVAACKRLRKHINEEASLLKNPARILFPHPTLCTDNGAMIAAAGLRKLMARKNDIKDLDIQLEDTLF